jgi:hypothetical protein
MKRVVVTGLLRRSGWGGRSIDEGVTTFANSYEDVNGCWPGGATAVVEEPGRPSSAGEVREHVLGIRRTVAWKAWVVDLAIHCRLDLADLVDQALADFARTKGFDKTPPKR